MNNEVELQELDTTSTATAERAVQSATAERELLAKQLQQAEQAVREAEDAFASDDSSDAWDTVSQKREARDRLSVRHSSARTREEKALRELADARQRAKQARVDKLAARVAPQGILARAEETIRQLVCNERERERAVMQLVALQRDIENDRFEIERLGGKLASADPALLQKATAWAIYRARTVPNIDTLFVFRPHEPPTTDQRDFSTWFERVLREE